jgi:hypothetical protein
VEGAPSAMSHHGASVRLELGERSGGQRAVLGECLVEAELVADDEGRGVHRGTEVGHELPDELIEPGLVDGHGGLLSSMVTASSGAGPAEDLHPAASNLQEESATLGS